MPVVLAVGDPLSLGVHWLLTGGAFLRANTVASGYFTFRHQLPAPPPPPKPEGASYHSVALHVARRAHGLVVLHHVRLPSEDAVTVETAEVLQVPVVALGLRVLVAEDQLRTHVRVRMEVSVWHSPT